MIKVIKVFWPRRDNLIKWESPSWLHTSSLHLCCYYFSNINKNTVTQPLFFLLNYCTHSHHMRALSEISNSFNNQLQTVAIDDAWNWNTAYTIVKFPETNDHIQLLIFFKYKKKSFNKLLTNFFIFEEWKRIFLPFYYKYLNNFLFYSQHPGSFYQFLFLDTTFYQFLNIKSQYKLYKTNKKHAISNFFFLFLKSNDSATPVIQHWLIRVKMNCDWINFT